MTSASSRQLAYLAFRRKGLISRTLNWVLQAWKDTLSKPQNERVVVRTLVVKNPPANARGVREEGSIPGSERPGSPDSVPISQSST